MIIKPVTSLYTLLFNYNFSNIRYYLVPFVAYYKLSLSLFKRQLFTLTVDLSKRIAFAHNVFWLESANIGQVFPSYSRIYKFSCNTTFGWFTLFAQRNTMQYMIVLCKIFLQGIFYMARLLVYIILIIYERECMSI